MVIIVDLSKPLMSKITVDGTSLLVEYEGLPIICFSCGKYGHLVNSYPLYQTEQMAHGFGTSPPMNPSKQVEMGTSAAKVNKANSYGEWMVVPPRGRHFNRDHRRKPDTTSLRPIGMVHDLTCCKIKILQQKIPLHNLLKVSCLHYQKSFLCLKKLFH